MVSLKFHQNIHDTVRLEAMERADPNRDSFGCDAAGKGMDYRCGYLEFGWYGQKYNKLFSGWEDLPFRWFRVSRLRPVVSVPTEASLFSAWLCPVILSSWSYTFGAVRRSWREKYHCLNAIRGPFAEVSNRRLNMPYANVGDVNLYYEIKGAAFPWC